MSKKTNISAVLSNNDTAPETAKKSVLKSYLINKHTEMKPLQPSIFIDETWIGTEGEILMISGEKKAGKSNALVYMLATALMKEVDTNQTLLIRTTHTTKDVVYIDTEQARQQTKRFYERICKIAEIDEPKNLFTYNIRKMEMEERLDFLQDVFVEHSNAHLIVIDGITDFIDSVNNEEQSKKIIEKVLKLLENGTTMAMVIHEGKDGNGARGHIGQEIERKCSGAISLSKDRAKGIHQVRCKLNRYTSDFDPYFFQWDKNLEGFRVLMDNEVKALETKSEETKNAELHEVCKQMFATSSELTKENVITGFLNYDKTIDKNSKIDSQKKKCRERLKKALELGFLNELENKNFTIVR